MVYGIPDKFIENRLYLIVISMLLLNSMAFIKQFNQLFMLLIDNIDSHTVRMTPNQ